MSTAGARHSEYDHTQLDLHKWTAGLFISHCLSQIMYMESDPRHAMYTSGETHRKRTGLAAAKRLHKGPPKPHHQCDQVAR